MPFPRTLLRRAATVTTRHQRLHLSSAAATAVKASTSTSQRSYGTIVPSISAQNTVNPIRRIVDNITAKPNPDLDPIPLSIGDPTVFGNFKPPDTLAEEIHRQAASLKVNGYGHSCGLQAAREAAEQASALLGVELACDFKARLAPTRAENVYA